MCVCQSWKKEGIFMGSAVDLQLERPTTYGAVKLRCDPETKITISWNLLCFRQSFPSEYCIEQKLQSSFIHGDTFNEKRQEQTGSFKCSRCKFWARTRNSPERDSASGFDKTSLFLHRMSLANAGKIKYNSISRFRSAERTADWRRLNAVTRARCQTDKSLAASLHR